MLGVVITTIQRPTASVFRIAECLSGVEGHLVIVGDTKGPDEFDISSVEGFQAEQLQFLDIDTQLKSEFTLAKLLPTKHYCRKNLGYLQAMRNGATCIYETDDDNAPLKSWELREQWITPQRHIQTDSMAETATPTRASVRRPSLGSIGLAPTSCASGPHNVMLTVLHSMSSVSPMSMRKVVSPSGVLASLSIEKLGERFEPSSGGTTSLIARGPSGFCGAERTTSIPLERMRRIRNSESRHPFVLPAPWTGVR